MKIPTHCISLIVGLAALPSLAASNSITPKLVYEDVIGYDGVWRDLEVHQFNPLRGILKEVRIYVFQRPATTMKLELTGGSNAVRHRVDTTVFARLYVRIRDGLLLDRTHRTEISGSRTYGLNGYDGVLDYGGTSGITREQYGTGGVMMSIRDLSVLTKFTGAPVGISNSLLPDLLSGTTNLQLRAALGSNVTVTPSAPFARQQSGQGRYTITVEYVYTPILG